MSYHPKKFAPMSFYMERKLFLEQKSTPQAFLERCIANITAREEEVRARVTFNLEAAQKAAQESTRCN